MIINKKGCKQNLVKPTGSSNSKIVLILWIEVIIFYVSTIIIDVRKLGLELISR